VNKNRGQYNFGKKIKSAKNYFSFTIKYFHGESLNPYLQKIFLQILWHNLIR